MTPKRLQDVKIAILAENDFEDIELFYPKIRLAEEGAEIVIVGTGDKSYEGKHGLTIEADKDVSDCNADEFDAVVVPGGYSPDHMRQNEALIAFVQKLNEQSKPIAAICHAPWVLAEADILKGRKVTSFSSIRTDLENAGASWVDKEVVHDENLITSRDPDDLGAFCRTLIQALS